MFKVVFMVFAIHGGVADEPLQMFGKPEPFATEEKCNSYLGSKDGKQFKLRIEKRLAKFKGEKLKAKFACVKAEEEKSEDDGSI